MRIDVATTAHLPAPFATQRRTLRNPLVLWHLFSLDAPSIAVLWTWTIAVASGVHLPWPALLAMGIAVWLLYAADRLLDTRFAEGTQDLEPRHQFHHLHRRGFVGGIILASIALAALLPKLEPEAVHLYLILGGLVFGYFVAIHAATGYNSGRGSRRSHRLPKEIAVGIFFSAAVFIPTIARRPALRLNLLPSAVLFGVVCSLNCLFIYTWEHPVANRNSTLQDEPHPVTCVALSFLPAITVATSLAGMALALVGGVSFRLIPTACCISALLLLLLNQNRYRLEPTTLRAMADLCLATPLLLLVYKF